MKIPFKNPLPELASLLVKESWKVRSTTMTIPSLKMTKKRYNCLIYSGKYYSFRL
jgi:hypothetical protein